MFSLCFTVKSPQFSCSALPKINYSSNHLFRYYCLDNDIQKAWPVILLMVRLRAEENGIQSALDRLAYLKQIIFYRKKNVAEDTMSWIQQNDLISLTYFSLFFYQKRETRDIDYLILDWLIIVWSSRSLESLTARYGVMIGLRINM